MSGPLAAVALAVALTPTPATLQVGDRAGYIDQAGGVWCVRVVYIDLAGPGGVPWAWANVEADPRRVVRAQAAQLEKGCK